MFLHPKGNSELAVVVLFGLLRDGRVVPQRSLTLLRAFRSVLSDAAVENWMCLADSDYTVNNSRKWRLFFRVDWDLPLRNCTTSGHFVPEVRAKVRAAASA